VSMLWCFMRASQ
jgi:hypothetical protein